MIIFRCINCGHERGVHDPNWINEPPEEFPWLEEVKPGYTMNILTCMGTPWPADYVIRAALLDWGDPRHHHQQGYVSPNPEKEATEYEAAIPSAHFPTSALIVHNPRRGGSVAYMLE